MVAGALLTIIVCSADAAIAQPGVTAGAEAIFYGDNTEFRNPFREGETLFGAAVRLDAGLELSERVTLSLGISGNSRFGAADAFELVRPIASLRVQGRRSAFIFGTLPGPSQVWLRQPEAMPAGPDRNGPHGLLPPLQRETLAFERPYEAGLQWSLDAPAYEHEAWLAWQRLNTPRHRERFDAGARGSWSAAGPLAIPFQVHFVHEGGQLFAAGPVRDSFALASGVVLSNRRRSGPKLRAASGSADRTARADADARRPAFALELWGLWSRYTPDREARTLDGGAFFGRAAAAAGGWRGHLIMWRGDDFVKDEGDPNYFSLRRDGRRYRGVRDYAEAGLTRSVALAPDARLEASFRMHRVERHYEYSYRVLAVASVRGRVR